MDGVNDRVKEFLTTWKMTHCAGCEVELQDGRFIMLDGRLYCLSCHANMKADEVNELNKSNKLK